MPTTHGLIDRTHFLADLAFCAATLHPIVSRICVPHILAPGAEATLKLQAEKSMREYFALIDDRLNRGKWWYGDEWSVLDAYLFWIFSRVEGCGFNVSDFTNYRAHSQQMKKLPAVDRALAREEQALAREAQAAEGSTP
ncbi:MAG: glutathione binding-like protein [Parvularculaceae bacterium]